MDKRSYFWLGAFGSFGAYVLIVIAFYWSFFWSESVKKVALKSEQSSIEVSMVDFDEKSMAVSTEKPSAPMETPKNEIKKEKEPQKELQKPKEKDVESTKKIISEIVPKKSIQTEKKESAPVATQNSSSAKDLVANLSIKKNSDVSFSSNSDGEVNEYLSNIAKMIKQGWSPAKSDAGFWAVVFVKIEPDGSFGYKIKRGSDREFVYKLEEYMEFLKKRGFPPPTSKKSVEVEFNFRVKE